MGRISIYNEERQKLYKVTKDVPNSLSTDAFWKLGLGWQMEEEHLSCTCWTKWTIFASLTKIDTGLYTLIVCFFLVFKIRSRHGTIHNSDPQSHRLKQFAYKWVSFQAHQGWAITFLGTFFITFQSEAMFSPGLNLRSWPDLARPCRVLCKHEKHLPEWHFYLPQKKGKKVIFVLKVVCPQYTFCLPNSGYCYFLVFQNACPNLTSTCPRQSGKCLCSTLPWQDISSLGRQNLVSQKF